MLSAQPSTDNLYISIASSPVQGALQKKGQKGRKSRGRESVVCQTRGSYCNHEDEAAEATCTRPTPIESSIKVGGASWEEARGQQDGEKIG